jgi:hypothetical protein
MINEAALASSMSDTSGLVQYASIARVVRIDLLTPKICNPITMKKLANRKVRIEASNTGASDCRLEMMLTLPPWYSRGATTYKPRKRPNIVSPNGGEPGELSSSEVVPRGSTVTDRRASSRPGFFGDERTIREVALRPVLYAALIIECSPRYRPYWRPEKPSFQGWSEGSGISVVM